MKTLTIRIESLQDALSDFREAAVKKKNKGNILGFASYDDFAKVITGNRLRMIETLVKAGKGMTVRELAEKLGRNLRGVHDDIKVLERYELLVNERGNVHTPYDDLHIDVHISNAA